MVEACAKCGHPRKSHTTIGCNHLVGGRCCGCGSYRPSDAKNTGSNLRTPEMRRDRRMPPCATCGHGWPMHVIPGGVENIDIYPRERWCAEDYCRCRNYVELPETTDAAKQQGRQTR